MREVIFQIVKCLLNKGIDPGELNRNEYVLFYYRRILIEVESEVDSDEFVRLFTLKRKEEGKSFEPKRFYCSIGEPIKMNGRTYAVNKQWIEDQFWEAISHFKKIKPDLTICVRSVKKGNY